MRIFYISKQCNVGVLNYQFKKAQLSTQSTNLAYKIIMIQKVKMDGGDLQSRASSKCRSNHNNTWRKKIKNEFLNLRKILEIKNGYSNSVDQVSNNKNSKTEKQNNTEALYRRVACWDRVWSRATCKSSQNQNQTNRQNHLNIKFTIGGKGILC